MNKHQLFERILVEALTWCERCGPSPLQLRSDVLQPVAPLKSLEWLGSGSIRGELTRRSALVETVIQRRRSLLTPAPIFPEQAKISGRILVLGVDQCMDDCLASEESGGLFDCSNTPPWDTWIDYIVDDPHVRADAPGWPWAHYLLAYIPSWAVATAQRGVDICPDGSLLWADDRQCSELRFIRESPVLREWSRPQP